MIKPCACGCSELISDIDKKGRLRRYVNHHGTRGRRIKPEDHSRWKGGRYECRGYVLIKKKGHPKSDPRGYVPEQILVMEQHIGRNLTKEEVVHHVNEVKNDNRIENLLLMSNNSEHTKLHNAARQRDTVGRFKTF